MLLPTENFSSVAACVPSPLWFIGCERLPHIRLGNPELSSNPCWRDARLEGGANGVHLATGQRNFGGIHGAWFRKPLHRQVQGVTRRLLRIAPTLGGSLPRRFISSSVAAWSKSNSTSLKCLMALRRFFGKTCRCDGGSAVACVAGGEGGGEASRPSAGEKRSGVVCSSRSHPMTTRIWR